MPSPIEILPEIPLPSYVLIKNMLGVFPGVSSFDAADLDGEVLDICDSFDEASAQVPFPPMPAEPQKRKLLKQRFGEDIVYDHEDDEWKREPAERRFDTSPDHNALQLCSDLPRDFDIFGECYTIVWVCPADAEAVVARLLQDVARWYRGAIKSSPQAELLRLVDNALAPNVRRIDAYALADIWEQYIDRMCFFAPEFAKLELEGATSLNLREDLRQRIIDEISRRLNDLPNGPTTTDWDRLDEVLLK